MTLATKSVLPKHVRNMTNPEGEVGLDPPASSGKTPRGYSLAPSAMIAKMRISRDINCFHGSIETAFYSATKLHTDSTSEAFLTRSM
jgi:hypothetical protein